MFELPDVIIAVLSDVRVFDDGMIFSPIEVEDITIFRENTVFVINGKEVISRNSWTFADCCAGHNPSSKAEMVYKDKWCACRLSRASIFDSTLVKLTSVFNTIVSAHLFLWVVSIALSVVSPRAAVLAIILWIMYSTPMIGDVCT